jgi:hypothetical protein
VSPSDHEERRRRTIERALEEIRGMDLEGQAQKGGFDCEPLADNGYRILIPTFGESLELILPQGEMTIPSHIDAFSLRVLSLRYIKLSCGVPVSGEWIAYRDLPGGRFYAATLAPTVEQPLAQAYGGSRGDLGEAAREIGGEEATYGDESYIFYPFPRVPLLLVLHWGDDEFEPDSRVLFDRCCSHYMNTDDLKILATQLAAYLLKKKGKGEMDESLLWMVE